LKLSLLLLESYFLGRFDDVAIPQGKVEVKQFEGWCSERVIEVYYFHELCRKGTACSRWNLFRISGFFFSFPAEADMTDLRLDGCAF
jgi:hypothetical protein